MFPPTIFPYPFPQRPDLRCPCSALRDEVVARLSLPAAAPPALVRFQPLRAGHPAMEKGAYRGMAGEQLVVALCCRLPDLAESFSSKACSPRGTVPASR